MISGISLGPGPTEDNQQLDRRASVGPNLQILLRPYRRTDAAPTQR